MHIRAEHLHLFPAILESAQNDEPNYFIRESISQLKDDHNFFMRELADAVKQLRVICENNWRDERGNLDRLREKIVVLRERLERHNRLEESDVYSRAETLTPEKEAVLLAKIQKELENLPPRFRKIV